jgi:protein TonB
MQSDRTDEDRSVFGSTPGAAARLPERQRIITEPETASPTGPVTAVMQEPTGGPAEEAAASPDGTTVRQPSSAAVQASDTVHDTASTDTETGSRKEAVLQSGQLRNDDYPRRAKRRGAQGSVTIRYRVETDGRVSRCNVLVSSGHSDLDSTTCRLVQERYRYSPARNAVDEPVEQSVTKLFEWFLVPRKKR